MRNLLLWVCVVFCAVAARAQSWPIVAVDHAELAHEQRGWRVLEISPGHTNLNILKNDLIVRADGKNAAEIGPMQMASLLNMGLSANANLFIERGNEHLRILLRHILAGDYSVTGPVSWHRASSGFSAPDFELTDIDQHPVSSAQYKNQWLLVEFVATWCAPCMNNLPQILQIATRRKLNLLLIALDDRDAAVRHMRHQYDIEAPIVSLRGGSPFSIGFGITTNYGTGQIPAFVLIHPDGDVALIGAGYNPFELDGEIGNIVAKASVPGN